MARRLRIEYPGALHHVINRGNYRRDLFENVGAAEAFLRVLFEAADKFSWWVHAYVLMRNHFHLAIETPQPNLGDGMHWLQTTMSARFNRLRKENGHLFQGRYKSLVIEDVAALCRVVDYIHLNPVRARVVPPEQVCAYRWSSLAALRRAPRPKRLVCEAWLLQRGGWQDDAEGIRSYGEFLKELAADENRWALEGLTGLGGGWAIGSRGWMMALAKAQDRPGLTVGLAKEERVKLRQARWEAALDEGLLQRGKSVSDLVSRPMKQDWKLELAGEIRESTGASIGWLASHLHLGGAATLRGYLHHRKHTIN